MKLTDALEATVGSGFGTFISCLPGELGFFEDEEKQVLLRYASSSR